MPVPESPSMRELRAFVDRCHAAITKQSQGHPEPFLELWWASPRNVDTSP